MQFLYPNFLWALLTLAIPIVVHLFYFRRFKKVYFTNVQFLKEVKEETSSRNRLKNLLVLLMRCLALAALVFAFAQPYLPTSDQIKVGEKEISVYVDNSFSMNGERENIPLLDHAKSLARDIINAYPETDRFQVLTSDFEGSHQRLTSQEDALAIIDQIQPSPAFQDLTKVLNRQNQVLKGIHKISYIISDFQRTGYNLEEFKDTTIEINLVPVQAPTDKNLGIDSVWFESPIPMINQVNNLIVRVKNYSDEEAENVKVSILKDGMERPIGVVNIPAQGFRTDTVSLSLNQGGLHRAQIKLLDYPVQFDDDYFVSFNVPANMRILDINDGNDNRFMGALFDGIPYFQYEKQSTNQIQYQSFSGFDLIILDELSSISSGLSNELAQYVRDGGNVLVFPSSSADLNSYNGFFNLMGTREFTSFSPGKQEVGYINTDEYIFSDVFENVNANLALPVSEGRFGFSQNSRSPKETILRYRDGQDYLAKFQIEEGRLYVCAVPLKVEFNDLVKNAEIFVPMIYKMAISTGEEVKIGYTIGEDQTMSVTNQATAGGQIYKIVGEEEFIPAQINAGKKMILDFNDQVTKAGFYQLQLGDNPVGDIAFNYNKSESDLRVVKPADLMDQAGLNRVNVLNTVEQSNLQSLIGEKDSGVILWKWFLIAALAFLLIEIVLIRLIK